MKASDDDKTKIRTLLMQIIDSIGKDPDKAAKVIESWVEQSIKRTETEEKELLEKKTKKKAA